MLLLLSLLYAAATAVLLAFGVNHLILAAQRLRGEGGGPPSVGRADAFPPPSGTPPREEREGGAHLPGEGWPAVTVQLPLYNERAVAARLIDACAALDYPPDRLELQVLDDSTDDTPALVAERVAYWRGRGVCVEHVRRAHREGYKAGALAHGLASARGELVAVFDADFVPAPDFLRRTVPAFGDARVGVVQARWAHLNADASALTDAQAALLDAHFLIEQAGRARAGWPLAFNGTAGVWRRAAIEDAGGWSADTLAEDLDLSYRAQLRGWRVAFLEGVSVPAELPDSLGAWRQQQFRWTKGGAGTARKLLGALWRAPLSLGAKLQGTMHLGGFAVYPAALALVLLHAPLLAGHALGAAVPGGLLRVLGAGLLGFAGVAAAHALAQRALHPDWRRRMLRLPWWLAAAVGLAASNTRAAAEGLRGRPSAFLRTPKGGGYPLAGGERRAETALAAYATLGLAALAATGAWGALPFQALFVAGFGYAALAGRAPRGAGRAARRTFRPECAPPSAAR